MSISNVGWAAALPIAWVAAAGPGKIEGALFPVVAPLDLTEVREVAPGVVELSGYIDRLRDCSFEGVEFRVGSRDGTSVPAPDNQPQTRLRHGRTAFEKWRVEIGAEPVEALFADVYHTCRTAGLEHPWRTVTIWRE